MKQMKIILNIFIIHSFAVGIISAQTNQLEEIRIIADSIESSLANLDKTYLNSLFKADAILNKFLYNDTSNSFYAEFNKGFSTGFRNRFDFGETLLLELKKDGHYNYLRYWKEDDESYHILFRLYADSGLNYHDYKIVKQNENFLIDDVYIYLAGETFSQSIGRVYGAFLLQRVKEKMGDTIDKLNLIQIQKITDIKVLLNENKYEEALKIYNSVPDFVKKEKPFRLIKIFITQNLEEEKYLEAMDEYANAFPNDPSQYLTAIDRYFLQKNYEKTLEMIDSIDSKVGGDDFLDIHRANVYYQKGDLDASEYYFKRLTENYPYFVDGYDSLLSVYIIKENYKEAVNILDILIEEFSYSKESLVEAIESNFETFFKSPVFNKWKAKK